MVEAAMDRREHLFRMLREVVEAPTDESLYKRGLAIIDLMVADKGYVKVALETPEILTIKIPATEGHTNYIFAHGVATTFPEESLVLFEYLKENSAGYLPILAAIAGNGLSVGVGLVRAVIQKDDRERESNAILQGKQVLAEKIAGGLPTPKNVAIFIPEVGPTGSRLRIKLADSLEGNPKMEEVFRMEDGDRVTVAQLWAMDGYLSLRMIDLIKTKQFFVPILKLDWAYNSGYSIPAVLMGLVNNQEKAGKLLEAMETCLFPTEMKEIFCHRIKSSKDFDAGFIHWLLYKHGEHIAHRINKLLNSDPSLKDVFDLKAGFKGLCRNPLFQ